ncbi:unnamed protein product, partial [Soboliphyme baturini]|uniref:Exportin-T n=1 Tax=Soboliphyme baturini TaxID=241478 RepID=A0A183IWS6_9BILA
FQDEKEDAFLQLRSDLKILLINLGQLDQDLFFEFLKSVVENALNNWRHLPFQEVESAISMLYHVGEIVKLNAVKTGPANDKIFAMLQLLVKSDVSQHSHTAVVLAYFETVSRYERLLAVDRELVLSVVTSFLDQRGLHHPNPKVVCRTVYLFSRFVRSQKLSLSQYAQFILTGLQDLLDGSRSLTPLLRPEQQVFLYESIGVLIISGNFQNQEKHQYLQQVLTNLIERFNGVLSMLNTGAGSAKERTLVVDYLNSVMINCSRLTKGFTGQITAQSCECQDLFVAALNVFTDAMTLTRCELFNGYKQYLHRMVICLEGDFLPCLPKCVQCLVAATVDFRSAEDLITFLLQVIIRYKEKACPSLELVFSTVFTSIWKILSIPVEENNQVSLRELSDLRRSYYQLLCALFSAKLSGLLNCQAPSVIEPLLDSIADGFRSPDITVKKAVTNATRLLINITKDFGPPGKEYFESFLMSRAIPLCFSLPCEDGFDFMDAQSLQILNEIGLIMKDIFVFRGEELYSFLYYILNSKIPAPMLQELCQAVKQYDIKELQRYLRTFFHRRFITDNIVP